MYKVIHEFLDLQDNSFHYKEGDTYPRDGIDIDTERVNELSGTKNKIGIPLIEEIVKGKPKVKQRTKRNKE